MSCYTGRGFTGIVVFFWGGVALRLLGWEGREDAFTILGEGTSILGDL